MRLKSIHKDVFKNATHAIIFRTVVCILFPLLQSQSSSLPEYKLKAVFLYNFTQFVSWPPDVFSNTNDPFVIGILGKDPFGSYLDETVAGEKIGSHPLKVVRYHNMREVNGCQMLFMNSGEDGNIKETIRELNNRNILTVSDMADFTNEGGVIGFVNVNNRIKLQINLNAAKAAGLTISSKLLRVAELSK